MFVTNPYALASHLCRKSRFDVSTSPRNVRRGYPYTFIYETQRWGLLAVLCAGLLLVAGCSVGPKYVKPTTQIPPSYKETGNWKPAEPSDGALKGNWWEIFQDAQLNALEEKLSVSNQTLRAAQDQFMEARAALRISRSARFPLVTVGSTITRNRGSLNRALANPNGAGLLFGFSGFRRRCFL